MSTLTLMPIRLASDSLAQKYRKNNKPATRQAVQWMDVSDDEDRPRKTPLKVHGVLPNGQNRPQTNGRKRHRASQNGYVVSTPSTTIQEQKNSLPIAKGKAAIIEEIRNNDVTVLIGETGSGKTTLYPGVRSGRRWADCRNPATKSCCYISCHSRGAGAEYHRRKIGWILRSFRRAFEPLYAHQVSHRRHDRSRAAGRPPSHQIQRRDC
ncbi:hypothetical protein EDD85DRAFT_421586 [Armillaria nabsnona]|nr:hypothetical protein EDD85DRAFT_421586 [Armillaria nabsnona]